MSDQMNPEQILDHYKKLAKQVLRWHQDGKHTVAQQIRSFLPDQFGAMDDAATMKAELKLADAQKIIARQAGFNDWQGLKRAAEAGDLYLTGDAEAPGHGGGLQAIKPCLFVSDIQRSHDWFRDVLGFDDGFIYGDPPFYGEVHAGDLGLSLRCADDDYLARIKAESEAHEFLAATITVDQAKPLFQAMKDKGVQFFRPLTTEPWGGRAFYLQDPDGNLLCIMDRGGPERKL